MGSDSVGVTVTAVDHEFQSTLPHGERPGRRTQGAGRPVISIHAPAWGATFPRPIHTTTVRNFNPRSRMGSDAAAWTGSSSCAYFNPRSRMGSDRSLELQAKVIAISIHAPAWGATHRSMSQRPDALNFNPRSRMGSDRV